MKLTSKAKLIFILCVMLCLSLCGCGKSEDNNKDVSSSKPAAESTITKKPEDSDKNNTSDNGGTTDNDDGDGANNDGDDKSNNDDNDGDASDNSGENGSDTADTVQYTDPLSPAPLGEWIKAATYNPVSESQEVIYWRVVSVSEDGQASVDAYNNGNNFWILEQPEEDFIKYYEFDYEIKYPEEYSQSDFGITVSDLSLEAEKPDGKGFEKNNTLYLGVGSCTDVTADTIGEGDENPRPGDTIQRKAVFTMMTDYNDYVFSYSFKDVDGERKTSYAASH